MKIGGPEGGGGEGFFSGAREKLRGLTQYPESNEPTREERAVAEQQVRQDALKAQYEQSQTPEARETREAKVNEFVSDLNRMSETRSTEEVDRLLSASNTDITNNSIRAEAYDRWKEGRVRQDKEKSARQALEAAQPAEDNQDELAVRRAAKAAEGSGEETAA